MFTFSKISTIAIPWACRLQGNIHGAQQMRKLSMTAVCYFEDFLDKEFAKAQRDLDTDALENPDVLLKKLERDQKRRIYATKRARTARLFRPPKEPRTLTWDTIEQIRYLKQENGDEWTTEKLAASFEITEALVIKVLKSKFVPTEKMLRKQDETAKVNAGLLPDKTGAASRRTCTGKEKVLLSVLSKANQGNGASLVKMTPSNSTDKAFPMREPSHYQKQQRVIAEQRSGDTFLREVNMSEEPKSRSGNRTSKVLGHQSRYSSADGKTDYFDVSSGLDSTFSQSNVTSDSSSRLSKGYKTGQHRRYPTEMQKEDYMEGSQDEDKLDIDMEDLQSYYDETPPPRIIRKGDAFFDENGVFLYRL